MSLKLEKNVGLNAIGTKISHVSSIYSGKKIECFMFNFHFFVNRSSILSLLFDHFYEILFKSVQEECENVECKYVQRNH